MESGEAVEALDGPVAEVDELHLDLRLEGIVNFNYITNLFIYVTFFFFESTLVTAAR